MSEDMSYGMIESIMNTLKNNYAMSFFEILPDDDGKKFIMRLVENGCPPRVILDTLIEFQKEVKSDEN